MSEIAVSRLTLSDAHRLAPLRLPTRRTRSAARRVRPTSITPNSSSRTRWAEIAGAWLAGRLIGFAVYLDLPDTMSGLRAGQLNDLFVIQDAREKGAGRALVSAVMAEGVRRGWAQLRWIVPEKPESARRLANKLAKPGRWASFVLDL